MIKLLIRCGIVGLWILLIFSALYFPDWKVLPYEKNSINIFAWGDILDPAVIAQFEKETKIKVNLNFYSSNEELLVKLKATHGTGYDIIIPSDYAVAILREENLLKELDRSKLEFWNELNPLLLGHPFDPQNHYSIPFEWEIYALAVDKTYFANRPLDPSWKLIFDKDIITYKIAMTNDPIEAVQFGAFYLYGTVPPLGEEQLDRVKHLLIQQKQWVEAYASFRADYFLATRNCPVVISSSSYLWRTMRLFDFVQLVVPKEGTFITIENLCIPAASTKDALVYRLINFLYRPEIVASHFQTFGFFPSTLNAFPHLKMDSEAEKLIRSTPEQFKKFHFIDSDIPEQQIRDLWVEVKSGSY
jgi:spermidine/putrescine transport system substrate-binding protein